MTARLSPRPGRLVVPDVHCDLAWIDGHLMFSGPLTASRPSIAARQTVLLASFDPLVVRAWLNIPLHFVTDCLIPFADLAPQLSATLVEHFSAASMNLLAIPRAALHPHRFEDVLGAATAELRIGRSVGDTAAAVGVSERQLERIFRSELGMGPKIFGRILRLRRALALASAGKPLVTAAVGAGYADQSHFTREARALMGASPSTLLPHVGNVQDLLQGSAID